MLLPNVPHKEKIVFHTPVLWWPLKPPLQQVKIKRSFTKKGTTQEISKNELYTKGPLQIAIAQCRRNGQESPYPLCTHNTDQQWLSSFKELPRATVQAKKATFLGTFH